MKRARWLGLCYLLAAVRSWGGLNVVWTQVDSLPESKGLAGCYAGVSGGALVVAGGANFPDKYPWDGGTKTWHDDVYVLDKPEGHWRRAGHLPRPAAYGLSITLSDGVLLIGGGDRDVNFQEVWLMSWDTRGIYFAAWPALPARLAMAAGALVGRIVYVAGGMERPGLTSAVRVFLALDLDHREAGWRTLPPWPGPPLALATAAENEGDFYLFGGSGGNQPREFFRGAYLYRPGSGWRTLADLPRGAAACPGGAVSQGSTKLLLLGGDDGVHAAEPPAQQTSFARDLLAYDIPLNRWASVAELPFSLAAAPLVKWRGRVIIAGGEPRPGWRSDKVWTAELDSEK
jgi:N-acetylneuraminate epimerase